METVSFYTLLIMFGGVVLYFLTISIFKFYLSKASYLGAFIIALIPVLGTIFFGTVLLFALFDYQKDGFYLDEFIMVKDTKINRWLFDDVDWKEYDKHHKQYNEK